MTEKARRALERKVKRNVSQHAKIFVRKKLPRRISRILLGASAKRAARRAASLVPVVSWEFAAQDAYHAIRDIFRGHVARGLSGVGLSVTDVASDFSTSAMP